MIIMGMKRGRSEQTCILKIKVKTRMILNTGSNYVQNKDNGKMIFRIKIIIITKIKSNENEMEIDINNPIA